ncbi:FAD/NAD(P)-binding protein [Micromonospora sp. NPDC049274]|uniref:FAD/NAD(P)-binding protein n=1 Tax=Micromonospora sp. NPDC049274 TaxID=3154829 RepID=UPI00343837B0
MTALRIAVVGCGPRGLSAVERVSAYARSAPDRPVELIVVEPGVPGVGIHHTDQPDYLLLNTVAGQLTIFSDEAMVPDAPVTAGPDLFRWCRERGVTVPTPTGPRGIRFDDFLPRRLLGEYLTWAAGELLATLPANVRLDLRRQVATAVEPAGAGARVTLDDRTELVVDLVIVTTGHGVAAEPGATADPAWIGEPYPLPSSLDGVGPAMTVGVLGAGLTGMDVVAALTVGRGGRHEKGRYVPSGREPRIVLVNRTGWLPAARPRLPRSRVPSVARHLTRDAVAELRARAEDGRIDLWRDIEPLMLADVEHGLDAAGRRTVRRLLGPAGTWDDHAEWRGQVLEQARYDLGEAERGLGESPLKDRLELLRDHRETLRRVVDEPGLTDSGHRDFFRVFTAMVNRAVIGPQRERIAEVLALAEAGVLDLGPGPAPGQVRTATGWELRSTALKQPMVTEVDVLVSANLGQPAAGPLLGWARPGRGAGELDLTRDGYVRTPAGSVTAVAVFGPPAEGASYYNHYVPSPGVWSRALTDLDRILANRMAPIR